MWKICIVIVILVISPTVVLAQGGDDGDMPLAPPPDIELPLGEVAYVADFSTEENWQLGAYSDGTLEWEAAEDGSGIDIASVAEGPSRFVPGTSYLADNFYAEMEFTPTACTSDESAMLFNVRSDPTSDNPTVATSYVFVVECGGTYRSRIVNEGQPGLIDFRGMLPAPLTLGDPIRIGVVVNGRQVSWFMNGETLGSYLGGGSPIEGQFALGAQLGVEATITDLRVWTLSTGDVAADGTGDTTGSIASSDPLATSIPGRSITVEDFDDPQHELLRGVVSDTPSYRIGDLVVIGSVNAVDAAYLSDAPDSSTYHVTYTEVIFQARHCDDDGAFGLALGQDDENFIGVLVQCDGEFSVQDYSDGDPGESYLNAILDPLEPFGQGHLIGVVIGGTDVFVYYDNQLLGTFVLEDAVARQLGVAWVNGDTQRTEVAIDNFQVVELLAR